jgi:hypothetical protein
LHILDKQFDLIYDFFQNRINTRTGQTYGYKKLKGICCSCGNRQFYGSRGHTLFLPVNLVEAYKKYVIGTGGSPF